MLMKRKGVIKILTRDFSCQMVGGGDKHKPHSALKSAQMSEEMASFEFPRPDVPVAEGAERDALREELRQIAA